MIKDFIINRGRTWGVLSILLLIAAIPLTLYLSQRQQDIRQRAATNFSCNPTSPSFNAHPPAGTLTMSATSVGVGGTVSFTLSGEAPLTVPEIPSISIQKMELYYRQESPTKGTWTKIGITGNDNCLVGNCPVNPAVTNPWTVTWNPPSAGTYTIAANIYTNMGRISGTPDLGTPNFIPSIDANHCCSKTIEYPPGTPNQPYCWTGPDSGLAKTLTVTSQTVTNPPVTNPPTNILNPTSLPTPKVSTPTPTPTITFTPTPTISPSPIPTIFQTPTITTTPVPGNTYAVLTIKLDAISSSPLHVTRQITAEVFNDSNVKVLEKTGTVSFDPPSGNFLGTLDLGNTLNQGNYTIKVKTNQYLRKQIPQIVTINPGTVNLIPVTLIAGDINNDNKIDLNDYNILIGCFGDKASTTQCGTNKDASDLDDNGVVDIIDYNIFIRNITIRSSD